MELSASARSSKYAAETPNISMKLYCRNSVDSAIIGGRNVANTSPHHAAVRPSKTVSHLYKTQPKIEPASTPGSRSMTSDVPRCRQK